MKNLIFGLILLIVACNNSSNNGTSNLFDPNKEEKEKITNQIEQVCFNMSQGVYLSEHNYNADDFPFYNLNVMELALYSGFTGIAQVFSAFSDKIESNSILYEPSGIKIIDFGEKEAFVSYKLHLKIFDEEKIDIPIEMTVKKIAGKWKLDGKKFFGNEEKK